ncbi:hypothetical protein BamMEX5DRAFT_2123 [Burkholderia ambifaria MEX-5]|uniref:Uncharacterized protein n=1 Tax=Burkholderia ambifaria MEX-5 TaxID=396597 RepID=B1T2V7_9BURK|nr:hypothetical protein BamMEX5DRAFT_2123 [Burkholderia ambifaria MEX-5]
MFNTYPLHSEPRAHRLPRIGFRQNMHSCYRSDRSRDRLALPAP